MPINDLPHVNPATVSAEIPSHLQWRPVSRGALPTPAQTAQSSVTESPKFVVQRALPAPLRPTPACPATSSGPSAISPVPSATPVVIPRLPLRPTTYTDATDAMPPAKDPTLTHAVVNALQRAHAQLPQSERSKHSKGQTVATWLRNQNFAGLNDALQDVVLRRFATNSGKLPRAGIKTAFGWLSDAQIEGLTALLARRYTYQGLSDWLADEQSLTADVSAALYAPR